LEANSFAKLTGPEIRQRYLSLIPSTPASISFAKSLVSKKAESVLQSRPETIRDSTAYKIMPSVPDNTPGIPNIPRPNTFMPNMIIPNMPIPNMADTSGSSASNFNYALPFNTNELTITTFNDRTL